MEPKIPEIGDIYYHPKTGNVYLVTGVDGISADDSSSEYVYYKSILTHKSYHRKLANWMERYQGNIRYVWKGNFLKASGE